MGILAALDTPFSTAWAAMLEDLPVQAGEVPDTWQNNDRTVRMGSTCGGTRQGWETRVVDDHGYVVAVDGWVRGPSAQSGGDASGASVVAESYTRWGSDCLRFLDGEFAFILFDKVRKRILCGCDVMGRRTLAFFWNGKIFLACTRAVTLLRHAEVPRAVDGVYVAQALCEQWAHPAGLTPFASIRRLRPGFCVTVEDGRLREYRVDQLRRGARRANAAGEQVDEFWSLIDAATRERLSVSSRACVLLSGGVDSACVLTSIAADNPSVDAFSLVDPWFPEEQSCIEAVLARHRSVRWESMAVAGDAPGFEECSDDLPLPDDPVLAAASLVASRRGLWRMVTGAGFSVAFDGEGGDEIFGMAARFSDLVQHRAWIASARYLLRHSAPSATVWRSVVLPRLPRVARSAWRARGRRRSGPRPPWLTAAYWRSREASAAQVNAEAYTELLTFDQRLPAILENPPSVGTTQANRLFQEAIGLVATSPMFDRRIAEFASGLSPSAMVQPLRSKPFLRDAAVTRLPPALASRPKDERLSDRLLRDALIGPRATPLAAAVFRTGLPLSWIDLAEVHHTIGRLRAGPTESRQTQEQLYALLALAGWWQRVEARYGILSWAAP